jgi:phage terminase small subunit
MSGNNGLTPKQAAFVEQYLLDLNATQAAIRAGYSERNGSRIGAELLGKTQVSAVIAAMKAERSERTLVGADRVLREIARVAFLDVGRAFNEDGSLKALSEMDEDTRRSITGIEVSEIRDNHGITIGYTKKLKLADKLRALELLGRHLGMFDSKVTVDAKGDSLTLLIQAVQGSSFKPVVIEGDKVS